MSAAAVAAIGGALLFAAAWELMGSEFSPLVRRRASIGLRQVVARAGSRRWGWLEPTARLERAGWAERVSPHAFLMAKVAAATTGALALPLVLPAAPARLVPVLIPGLIVAGFAAPDALAERAARRRQAQINRALPDVLDLLAVGAAAGRHPAALLAEVAGRGFGPLATELGFACAEIEAGVPQTRALARLRERTGAIALGGLAAALERSRRFGAPLADQLQAQASALRRDERRLITERAARAAPKIQLVVALVLVPSALLAVAAAIVAHADSLLSPL